MVAEVAWSRRVGLLLVMARSIEMEAAALAGPEAWDEWLAAGGEERRKLDARYARIT